MSPPGSARPRRRGKPRRLLLLVHSYYLRDTRPRRHAAALAAAGWEVDVLCARDAGEPFREIVDGGVRILRLPARRRRGSRLRYLIEYLSFAAMAFAAITLRHLARRYRCVAVIGIPNFIVFAALLPRLTGARVLLDMRDPLPEFFQSKYGLAEAHPLVRLLRTEERWSARFATCVLTAHPSFAALYRRTRLPPERIAVVWNPPDPRLFAPSAGGAPAQRDTPASAQRTLGVVSAEHTMLYAGTVAERYGVDLAVRALVRLGGEIPSLRLRVVGDGDLLERLRDLAGAEGVADRVRFDGPVPLDRIPGIVAEAWLGVQPNRADPLMRHSFSTKILEWCLLGLPVVCGATEALRETFSGSELLMHEPGDLSGLCDRIREAYRDPPGLAARAERARAVAARIRYEDQVRTLLTFAGGGERDAEDGGNRAV